MQRFAELLDSLAFQPARNAKLRLITTYLAATPDPDRGYALAALTGTLDLPNAKPALLREFGVQRLGETLFTLSYDYVGDLAETLSLVWDANVKPDAEASGPQTGHNRPPPSLGEIVDRLRLTSKRETPPLIESWLDELDATGRWALIKLVTGALRVGVSARLAKQAAADLGGVSVDDVEEVWHALKPPYTSLFDWLTKGAPRPAVAATTAVFRPLMLANPLEESELASLDPLAYRAEWKWDGIRVQLAAGGERRRIFTRGGDDATSAFPDILEAMDFDAVLDGELLVAHPGIGDAGPTIAPFNDLQQRLNRKTITPKMLRDHPAHIRLYDALFLGGEDLRARSFDERRARLEAWFDDKPRGPFDLSPLIRFTTWDELVELRAGARAAEIEGLMLKRADSAYVAGRPKGPWFKWKRAALTADCVLMYAQRGHGKRSSYYSDYTFGCWRDEELVPVGKAYSGFTDEELLRLDKWVRDHTTNRFGPVREVEPGLVLEIAFDAVQRSSRHKSGIAMRFPRVHRIRWDKPFAEADRLDALTRLLPAMS
ncbi:MAG: cisplatin damage response ATP-dependent DNA ligase [Alphaproteobacteria bacterium]|nr:cisplatin damage response ATP-dependent DNA ligase [Alphaproteobacteria bacterium]MCW5739012.1 cisplatin damage response ATP-dependent DNA ligase [Alphaproteobacteria bacterium]